MPQRKAWRSTRRPRRWAACSTMATTAGLMPNSSPATTGHWPKRIATHDSPIRMPSEGSTNKAPAAMPPRLPCSSQPM